LYTDVKGFLKCAKEMAADRLGRVVTREAVADAVWDPAQAEEVTEWVREEVAGKVQAADEDAWAALAVDRMVNVYAPNAA